MGMPSIPVSIFIGNEIKIIEGKTITHTNCEMIYEGKYSWHGDSFDNISVLIGSVITFADSHYIYTDSGYVIDFGYFHGDLRYYEANAEIERRKLKNPTTHAYMLTFGFHDGSCLVMTLYSWSTHFNIRKTDTRLKPSPIDATDFTLAEFTAWLSDNSRENIVENCSTAKGTFDIENPVMSYILLISGIHPRTKTHRLSDEKITELYNNTVNLMNEYKSGERICEYNSIFGKNVAAVNDIMRMTSASLGKPCPVCGTAIGYVPCAGTKMYICAECQRT